MGLRSSTEQSGLSYGAGHGSVVPRRSRCSGDLLRSRLSTQRTSWRRATYRGDPKRRPRTLLGECLQRHKDQGPYHKTRHGFALLAKIDPVKVEAGSPHAEAFHKLLRVM